MFEDTKQKVLEEKEKRKKERELAEEDQAETVSFQGAYNYDMLQNITVD